MEVAESEEPVELSEAGQVASPQSRSVQTDDAAPDALGLLAGRYNPADQRFRPEDSPFTTLFADITHRCNMACRN